MSSAISLSLFWSCFSLDAEVKRFLKLGQYIHNIIVVTRLFVEISNYILPILVLLKIINSPENYRITLKNTSSWKIESQSEREFDLNTFSYDDSIIDWCFIKKDIRVRVKTLTIIENLPVTNEGIPKSLLSRLPIRNSSVLSSLTGLSGKIAGRRKSRRNK